MEVLDADRQLQREIGRGRLLGERLATLQIAEPTHPLLGTVFDSAIEEIGILRDLHGVLCGRVAGHARGCIVTRGAVQPAVPAEVLGRQIGRWIDDGFFQFLVDHRRFRFLVDLVFGVGRVVAPPPAAAKAASPPTAVVDAKPNPKPPPFVDDTNDPIKVDPALQVKVTLEMRNPRLPHLLERLHEATGLKFTADSALDAGEPVFGTSTFVNTPAWWVMRSVAESPLVQGRWEKRAGGYHIVAAVQPLVALNASPKPEADAAPFTSGWLIGTVAAVPLLVAAALILFRRRGSRKGEAAP